MHASPSNKKDILSGLKASELAILLLCISFFTIWLFLDYQDVATANEGLRTYPPAEMLATGDWIVPRLSGEVYLKKPPLLYWQIAGTYAVLGRTEFTARLNSALFGTAVVLLTFFFGKCLGGRYTGFFAALFAATNLIITDRSRQAQLDIFLCFFAMLTLWAWMTAFIRIQQGREREANAAIYTGAVWLAFANMYKFPVPYLFVISAFAGTAIWTKQYRLLLKKEWYLAMLAALIPLGIWAVAVISQVGFERLYEVTLREFRYRWEPKPINEGPFYLYARAMIGGFAPWFLFWIMYAYRDVRRMIREKLGIAFPFLVSASLISVVFLSLVPARESIYMICAVPFQCILLGLGAACWLQRPGPVLTRPRRLGIVLFSALGFICVFHVVNMRQWNKRNERSSMRAYAHIVQQELAAGEEVIYFDDLPPHFYFQVGTPVPVRSNPDGLEALLEDNPGAIVLGKRTIMKRNKERFPGLFSEVYVVEGVNKEQYAIAGTLKATAPPGYELKKVEP